MTNGIPKGSIKRSEIWLPGAGVKTFEDVMVQGARYVVGMRGFNPHRKEGECENAFTLRGQTIPYNPKKAGYVQQQFFNCQLDNGTSLVLNPGDPKLRDHIFTKDAGRTNAVPILGNEKGKLAGVYFHAYNSRFYSDVYFEKVMRQPETHHYNSALTFLKDVLKDKYNAQEIKLHFKDFECFAEGGDTIYDPHRDWWYVGGIEKKAGVTPADGRSDPVFHQKLAEVFNMAGRSTHIPVRNTDYHMDVTLSFLPCGGAVVNPRGLHEADLEMIKNIVPSDRLIMVRPEDCDHFIANLMVLRNNTIIMPISALETRQELENLGYKVEQFDFNEFIDHAGGGPNCMNQDITFMRIWMYMQMLEHLEREHPAEIAGRGGNLIAFPNQNNYGELSI